MVSPPEKNGGEVDGGPVFEGNEPAPQQAALNGEAITYGSQTTFTEANPLSSPLTSQYISRRGPSGWQTQAITPEQDIPGGVFNDNQGSVEFSPFQGFSEDLSHAFLLAYEPSPVPGAPAKYFNPYVRDNVDNSYKLLSTATPPVARPEVGVAAEGLKIEYAGMSTDGSHVVFSANDKLTSAGVPGGKYLYEWSAGQLELVSELPDGEAVSGAVFGQPAEDQGGLEEDYQRVISADGSRVIWTGPGGVYVRELTAGGNPIVHGPLPGAYETASVDGSLVFTNSGGELFRNEVTTGKSTDLTGPAGDVGEVLGASEDGSYVYFLASGALAPGASGSLYNIYLWHAGAISFIAATSGADYSFVQDGAFPGAFDGGRYLLANASMRVSPSGRYLAFESSESLTGYDNVPSQSGACVKVMSRWSGTVEQNLTGRCVEVYEYDADSGRLTCASCNPRGLPPLGDSVIPMPLHNLVQPAGWQSSSEQQRYLLDDGRLFFDSGDALLPQASNDKLNVYEYEPDAAGSCEREGGCVSLISSGTSSEDSFFTDASASGDDAFFITRQQLVTQDGDEALDVYDARVGGGFASAVPPPCGGEACRPPVTPAPAIYEAPPSATFVGAGNPTPPAGQTVAGKSSGKAGAKRKRAKHKRKVKRKLKKQARRARARRANPRSLDRGSHR